MSGQSDPRTDSSPAPEAGDVGPGPDRNGPLDAAEAAGFGGITWADEAGDGAAGAESDTPDASDLADPLHEANTGDLADIGETTDIGDLADIGDADSDVAGTAEFSATGESASDVVTEGEEISVESLVADLERVATERDQYLDASRRLQAEFENYRKAVAKREVEARERANESLVTEILPVLDACDGAVANGAQDVEPVRASLLEALTKQGLARIDEHDAPFDPEHHEAVMHEPDDNGNGPVVAEVMRAGYSWKGRVVRPAMVRVRG